MIAVTIAPWTWYAIGAWLTIGAGAIALEIKALKNSKDGWPTATNLIKRYIPRWVLAMLLGLLAFHFLSGPRGDR